MNKKNYLYIVIFIFSILNFTIINATSNIVWPYSSSSECSKIRDTSQNNTGTEYKKYERSKCYKNNNWTYQYNICKKWEGCINDTSSTINKENPEYENIIDSKNPYSNKIIEINWKTKTIETIFWKKIKILIQKVKWERNSKESIKRLINLKDKLTKIWNKDRYKKNKMVQNLIWYINFETLEEVARLKDIIAKEEEKNWINDFLSELWANWEPEKPTICTREYSPVCATKNYCPKWNYCISKQVNKTYSNSCVAKSAWAKILYQWKCKEETKKKFKFGWSSNEYKYFSAKYTYGNKNDIIFRYGYDTKHNYAFRTNKGYIELWDEFKYKIIPWKKYFYSFYNPNNRRQVLYKWTFIAKWDNLWVSCNNYYNWKVVYRKEFTIWDINKLKKINNLLCNNWKINSFSKDSPWYYWSCKWKDNKIVYCNARMDIEYEMWCRNKIITKKGLIICWNNSSLNGDKYSYNSDWWFYTYENSKELACVNWYRLINENDLKNIWIKNIKFSRNWRIEPWQLIPWYTNQWAYWINKNWKKHLSIEKNSYFYYNTKLNNLLSARCVKDNK